MSQLKLAVIGAGLIGRDHIELVNQHAECVLSAIADPAEVSREQAAAAGAQWFSSLDEVLTGGGVDGVILATPNALHTEQAKQCIAAGVPALIEKPVAHTLEAGEALLSLANDARSPLMVGHHRMHSPIMRLAREAIDSGELGELVAITGSALFYKPANYFAAGPWRTQPGGGPILINMVHEIGNLRYLCGEIESVQAMSSNARRGHQVEDTVGIVLRFSSGVIGTFILSDCAASASSWEQTSQENKDYASYLDEDCYHVAGTYGSMSVPTMRIKRYTSDEGRSWYQPFSTSTLDLQRKDPLEEQLNHFCAVIRGDERPLVSVHDGLQNLRVTDAIAEAAASGTLVRL